MRRRSPTGASRAAPPPRVLPLLLLSLVAGLTGGCESLDLGDLEDLLDLEDVFEIPPAGGTGEPVVFQRRGVFLDATRAHPYVAFELPVESGARYRRIEVDFDLDLGPFHSNLFHGIHTFRGDRLYYSLLFRGDNRRTIVDLGRDTPSIKQTGPWRPHGRYHLSVVFDIERRRIELEIRQGGTVRQRVTGEIRRLDLRARRRPLLLEFSQRKVQENAFFPLWGSRYSNLRVVAEP